MPKLTPNTVPKGIHILELIKQAQKRRGYLLATAALFALFGLIFLRTSNAATYVVPLEAESGTTTGNQKAGVTSGASNSASIHFGGTGGGGGGGLTHTWLSGMSGIGSGWTASAFGSWRGGSAPTLVGTWSDISLDCSVSQCGLDDAAATGLAIDDAVGGIYRSSGESYAAMASGQLDSRFRQMLQTINSKWGNAPVMYLRFAHEFNGNWYDDWSVGPNDVNDFKLAEQHFYQLVQEELVAKGRNAKVAYAPNSDSHNGPTVTDTWPGDQYIDVVSLDSYDGNGRPYITDDASWQSESTSGTITAPVGVERWREFAEAHGKPLALSEWGLDPASFNDNPFYIQKMNSFFRQYGGTGAGNVLYDCLFSADGFAYKIYPSGNAPNAISMYTSLKWGK